MVYGGGVNFPVETSTTQLLSKLLLGIRYDVSVSMTVLQLFNFGSFLSSFLYK